MPVRSSTSSIVKWPDRRQVLDALLAWARSAGERHPELERVGYFGSYARGDWGIGSDLDVVLVLSEANAPFIERAAAWDLLSLPVPVDLLVYSQDEWTMTSERTTRWADDIVWVWSRPGLMDKGQERASTEHGA